MYQKFYKVNSMYQNFKKIDSLQGMPCGEVKHKDGIFWVFGEEIFWREIFFGGNFLGKEIFWGGNFLGNFFWG